VSRLRRVHNFLANMGLILTDDPPKVVDTTGREWGDAVGGLQLSIREIAKEDPQQLAAISVVLRNVGSEVKTLRIPGWLSFYQIDVKRADATPVPPTSYGKRLLKAEPAGEDIELSLAPGNATETDLPIATLFEMNAAGEYRVRVSCRLPEGEPLTSNELIIRV